MKLALKEFIFPSGQVLQVAQGDITAEAVDAIVNAANRHLEHGAGVAGAIVRRGGSQIQAESYQWVHQHGLVSHAEPAYTRAGNLPCHYVIHAVGPVWGDGDEESKLSAAIRGSLKLAERLSVGSIAIPAISTGIFGFPKPLAARICLNTIKDYMADNHAASLKLIRLVLFDQETLQAFVDEWEQDDYFNA